jgi:hypothetical protein
MPVILHARQAVLGHEIPVVAGLLLGGEVLRVVDRAVVGGAVLLDGLAVL